MKLRRYVPRMDAMFPPTTANGHRHLGSARERNTNPYRFAKVLAESAAERMEATIVRHCGGFLEFDIYVTWVKSAVTEPRVQENAYRRTVRQTRMRNWGEVVCRYKQKLVSCAGG